MKNTFEELFGAESAASRDLYFSRDDVRMVSRLGMLGTHSHSHVPLAGLTREEARAEVEVSLDILSGLVKEPISGVSYPFGGPSAVSEEVADCCRELGLCYGFTMRRDVAKGTGKDPMLLPRVDTNDVGDYVCRTTEGES